MCSFVFFSRHAVPLEGTDAGAGCVVDGVEDVEDGDAVGGCGPRWRGKGEYVAGDAEGGYGGSGGLCELSGGDALCGSGYVTDAE